MIKRIIFVMVVIFSFTTCFAKENILIQGFGEIFEDQTITFITGSYLTGDEYGLVLANNELNIALLNSEKNIVTYTVQLEDCNEVNDLIKDLPIIAYDSIQIMLGQKKAKEPDIVVTGGPYFKLTLESVDTAGSITLLGGYTHSHIVPWVDAALKLAEMTEQCWGLAN